VGCLRTPSLGPRHLLSALGEGMIATRFMDKPVFRRGLLPQDLKLEIPQLTREEAMATAELCCQ
jgi:hypothetical protein